jgi:hypothetical protein
MAADPYDLERALAQDLEQRQREQEDARLRAARISNPDPERSRRILSASAYTGLPEQVVDSDLDNIEKQILEDRFDPQAYRDESPEWASWLAENPYHLAALEDDMENMTWVGRTMKQIGMGYDMTKAQLEMSRLTSARIAQGGEFTPEQEQRMEKLRKMQVGHTYGAEGFAGVLVKTAQMIGPTAYSMAGGLEAGLGTGMAFGGAAALGGQAGPQAALPEELITVPAAFGMGMAVGFTPGATVAAYELESRFAYDEYREMGVDHDTALTAARTAGAINASLEGLAAKVFLKAFPGVSRVGNEIGKKIAGDIFARPTVARATGSLFARFGKVHGTEIATEIAQETVTAVTGEFIRPEGSGEPLDFEAYKDRIASVAEEVMVGAALISALGPTTHYYSDLRRAHRAKQNQAVFAALGDGAKASKTREALPQKFREWVGKVRESGAVENIWIDAARFDQYWQSIDENPSEIAERLQIDLDAYNEAREIGGDIAIPLEEYTTFIAGTDHHGGLMPDIKAHIGEMSAREAELFEANKPEIIRNIEEAAAKMAETDDKTAADRIVEDITGQLVAASYEQGTARANAQLLRGIANIAERIGVDPMEFYESIFGGVRRVQDDALQKRESVDMQIDPLIDLLRRGRGPTTADMFGPSLIDFLKSKGGLQDQGGELASRDIRKEVRGLVKDSGLTLDEAAELAAEAGYIAPQYDETMLLDALDREIRGEPVYGSREAGDADAREIGRLLDELEEMVGMLGLNLEEMSNEEVRAELQKLRRFEQFDDMTMEQLREMVEQLAKVAETEAGRGDVFDTIVAKATSLVPLLDAHQDFSGVTFTDKVRVRETGETVKISRSAQTVFDRAVKRKKNAQRLLDCVSG